MKTLATFRTKALLLGAFALFLAMAPDAHGQVDDPAAAGAHEMPMSDMMMRMHMLMMSDSVIHQRVMADSTMHSMMMEMMAQMPAEQRERMMMMPGMDHAAPADSTHTGPGAPARPEHD